MKAGKWLTESEFPLHNDTKTDNTHDIQQIWDKAISNIVFQIEKNVIWQEIGVCVGGGVSNFLAM